MLHVFHLLQWGDMHRTIIQLNKAISQVILYNGTPKKYEIADIKVSGVKNYEDYVLIGISGLAVGQTITVPGDDITSAVKDLASWLVL